MTCWARLFLYLTYKWTLSYNQKIQGEKISAPNVKRLRSATLHYKTPSPEQHNKRIHKPIYNMVYSSKKSKRVYYILLGLYQFFIDSQQKQLGRGRWFEIGSKADFSPHFHKLTGIFFTGQTQTILFTVRDSQRMYQILDPIGSPCSKCSATWDPNPHNGWLWAFMFLCFLHQCLKAGNRSYVAQYLCSTTRSLDCCSLEMPFMKSNALNRCFSLKIN